MQVISTSVKDINEVQTITTSASPRAEVQTITVSPVPGESRVASSYSFSLKLDTLNYGGSIQYSGEISATANADGSRYSLAEILGAMSNIDSRPTVTKSDINPDGGYTYSVTFPLSMKNVPQIEVYITDLPVFCATVEDGNVLGGTFRLTFEGRSTGDIPYNASPSEMQKHLESLSSIDSVNVVRSIPDYQNGYSWEIEFTSEDNNGNLEALIVSSNGLTTSNLIGGAQVVNEGGINGTFIQGDFFIEFGK